VCVQAVDKLLLLQVAGADGILPTGKSRDEYLLVLCVYVCCVCRQWTSCSRLLVLMVHSTWQCPLGITLKTLMS